MSRRLIITSIIVTLLLLVVSGVWRSVMGNGSGGQFAIQSQAVEIPVDGQTIKGTVFSPDPEGPYPAVIVLHGAEGWRQSHVTMAKTLASHGFVVLSGCWFKGVKLSVRLFPGSFGRALPCPDGPAFAGATETGRAGVEAMIEYLKTQPKVAPTKIGLVGQSIGGTAALLTAANRSEIQATVAIATVYPVGDSATEELNLEPAIPKLRTPILVVHGTEDEAAPYDSVKEFVREVEKTNSRIETQYYTGGDHFLLFKPGKRAEIINRTHQFLVKTLQ